MYARKAGVRCDGAKPRCMRCITTKLKCRRYETRKSASINSTELGYSFAEEAQDDDGYASTPEGFTKDLSQVQEMQRTGSDDSKASILWTKSRSMQHIPIQHTFVKSHKVAPKASSNINLPDKELPSLYVKSKDGSDAEIVTAIRKPLYQRPKHERLFCPFCNDKEGFRGAHKLNKLNRHCERQHKELVKKWVCIEPEDGIKNQFKPVDDLSDCEACHQGKKYGAYDNADAHLRHAHFRPKARDRSQSRKMYESDTRDVKGGADWPPMLELKRWMKVVYVKAKDEESRDEEPSGEEIHSGFDEDFPDLVSSDTITFDSNPLAPDDMQLFDYESFAAPSFSAQKTPSDTSMLMGMELPLQMSTFDSSSSIPSARQWSLEALDELFMDDDMAYTDGLQTRRFAPSPISSNSVVDGAAMPPLRPGGGRGSRG